MTEKKVEKKEEASESDKMWAEIKELPIEMFALPDQRVKHHAQRVKVTPNEVHLKLKSTAVVASLEFALAASRVRRYTVEVAEGYVIVRSAPLPMGMPKPEPLEK